MGVAVLSGVLSTIHEIQASQKPNGLPGKANGIEPSPTPETSQALNGDLDSLPSAYIATVAREESARRLSKTFKDVSGGGDVQIQAGKNIDAASRADVILLW